MLKIATYLQSIYKSTIANEVEKIKGKDRFKYSLKRSEKVKTLPMKTSVKLSSESKGTIAFDLLFQSFVFLENGCNISLDNGKRREVRVYPLALLELTFKCKKQKCHLYLEP